MQQDLAEVSITAHPKLKPEKSTHAPQIIEKSKPSSLPPATHWLSDWEKGQDDINEHRGERYGPDIER